MRGKLGDPERLQLILQAIQEIETYTAGATLELFSLNSMMRFATVKQLEIIGEACNFLTPELKDKAPQVEWRKIVGIRHMLVHEYFGISTQLVWQIVQGDLPAFKQQVKQLVDHLP
jgi:uncharacterized protein with HEPN domain